MSYPSLLMSFISLTFIVLFAILFALYWLVPNQRLRQLLLLIASYIFYGWLHPWLAVFLFTFVALNFAIAGRIAVSNSKRTYWFGVAFNIGLLALFKYFTYVEGFTIGALQAIGVSPGGSPFNLFLPLGISFFTLQTVSYLTDVHHGTLKHERDFAQFNLYVALFTKLIAGPIERGKNLLPQLDALPRWSWDKFYSGIQLVVLGYLFKVMVADGIGQVVDKVFILQKPSLFILACGALAFTLQIYADFAAYTNLARGFGKLLGIDHVENFNSPYLSISPADFWQRWHISFSSWLRDYIFFPVRRLVLARRIPTWLQIALPSLVTMLVSGIWHGVGWTFIVWGLYFGVLLAAYQLLGIDAYLRTAKPAAKLFAWAVNFALIVIGWAIFRAPSLPWLANVFVHPEYGGSLEPLITGSVILALTAFYCIPMLLNHWLKALPPRHSTAGSVAYAAALILLFVFLQTRGFAGQDFIYFNF